MLDDVDLKETADLSRLEDFENLPSSQPMRPVRWSVEKYKVAQLVSISRMTVREVSEETHIPEATIRNWLRNPEFREYVDQCALDAGKAMKAKRLSILHKIIDARVEKAEETGDYSFLSNKDILDLLEMSRKETEADDSKDQSNYMTRIEELLRASQAKVIDFED